MLRFSVYHGQKKAKSVDLDGAYLVGSDGVPIRAEIEYKSGEIVCRKRATGPAGLALMWDFESGGRMMCETTRLPERDQPYNLQLELLRGRLMRIAQKREDWGLYDFEGTESITRQVESARDALIDGLKADTPAGSAEHAERGLSLALAAAEQLTAFHAEIFLNRRKQVGGFPRNVFGLRVDPAASDDGTRERVREASDFLSLPLTWKTIEPREREYNWDAVDAWVAWAIKHRIPIRGSDLISFLPGQAPDWLFVWEHDFEAIRDYVYEHIRKVVGRYSQSIQIWNVVTGLHAVNAIGFNFEQLMELTRMAVATVKQVAPRSLAVIDIVLPWGEYYAQNQRTIPPMLYADMVVQSGVNFDAFGVHCCLGVNQEGHFVRDIFQISSMLDRFAGLGKPVHLASLQVPSNTTKDAHDFWQGKQSVKRAGAWHRDWSEEIQRAWLRRVIHLALSKPFIETVTWRDFADSRPHNLPHGGLIRADDVPKASFQEWISLRNELRSDAPLSTPAIPE